MRKLPICRFRFPFVLFALLIACLPAQAQSFPQRFIRIIVPTATGGGYDLMARTVAPRLAQQLGQSVVVENRPGGGTITGTQAAAAAPADGYTLLVGGAANIALTKGLYDKLPFDPAADFTALGMIVNYPYVLVTRKDAPHSTLKEFIDTARANPGKYTVGSAGPGTGHHILAETLKRAAKVDVLVVQYRGAQLIYPDLVTGRIDIAFDTVASTRPQVEGGAVKLLAATSAKRNATYPDLATAEEQGLPGIAMDAWVGLFAPARTPKPIVDRLAAEIGRVVDDAEFRAQMVKMGAEMLPMNPDEADRFVKAEIARWTPLIRKMGISTQ